MGAEVFFPLFSLFSLFPPLPFLPALAPTGTAEVQRMATTAGIKRPKQQSFIVPNYCFNVYPDDCRCKKL
jgi:hypothetical protein